MTIRTAAGAAIMAVVAAMAAGACSVPDQKAPVDISGANVPASPSTVASPPSEVGTKVSVYFVGSGSSLVAALRPDPTGELGRAISDLLAGPSSAEVAAGISSAVPAGTKVLAATTSGGTADLNFDAALTSITGHEELLAFAQIVATATSVPGVSQVQISVEGNQVNAPLPDGTLAQHPVSRTDYAVLLSP